jgi:D-cysteine desulfhydrase/L-cysteate sulfo-lyase
VKPVLILLKKSHTKEEYNGNVLLNAILNADIRITPVKNDQKMFELKDMQNIIKPILEEEEAKGNSPYLAPLGGSLIEGSMSRALGAISYLQAFIEIIEQALLQNVSIDAIVLATGSASTQAGLLAGAKILAPEVEIVGISVSEDKQTMNRYINTITNKTFIDLGFDLETNPEDIIVFDEYIEEGYGVLNQKVADKIRLVASIEGILLDPVYTGKAMVGLENLIKKDYFKNKKNIVFLHSGGTPALFAYGQKLLKFFS